MQVYLDGEGPGNVRYKVDLPPDTTHHVIRYRLDMTALEYLLITHAHPDHLDTTFLEVRRKAISGREALRELQVYGSEEVEECIRGALLDLAACKVRFHRVEPFSWMRVGDLEVFPLLAYHNYPAMCFNYAVRAEGVMTLLAWDTGYWPDESWREASGLRFDAVFLECTVIGPQGRSLGPQHHDLATFLSMKERMTETGLIEEDTPFIAVHIGDNGLVSHTEAQRLMDPHHVTVGYDGLFLDLDRS